MPWLLEIPAFAVAFTAVVLALTPAVDWRRRRVLRRVLPDVCRVFEEHHIEYWCDFGTLLGFYREADIIGGDKDADLGIFASEKPRILALTDVFSQRGYVVTAHGGRAGKLLRIHDRRSWYYVDVYEYEHEGERLRSLLASPQEDLPAALVARRMRAPFLGTHVTVPEDVTGVLRHRYGADFERPRRGDKGTARPYSLTQSLFEDFQDNLLGVWSLVRTAFHARRAH